ncbi:ABC transporter permease [Lysinibacter cavernae]|uniref:Osmoprotectant transport system permease protein n=1 Tax=Lysinibacter cavernae TaxID=1640652 RepID=A0A7X5TS06_9MICO|nr:ABC transporter permease subunit [Lysinibacter cavernae]NIH52896.1 osmoprotectant transport system permease protein [Lysinibacter cavernae]
MDWVIANWPQIWSLTLSHLWLSLPPTIIGLLLALPLGWLAHRFGATRGVLLTVSGLLYTIPSLPLFIIMPLLLGTRILDPLNVVIALTLYAVALLLRSVTEAFDSVSNDVRQSSISLGFSPVQRVLRVELPLALPVVIAAMRVVSASTISLVSVGSLIGVSSLGYLFTNGFQRNFPTEIMVGIVGTILLAGLFDLIIVGIGRVLLPWSRVKEAS